MTREEKVEPRLRGDLQGLGRDKKAERAEGPSGSERGLPWPMFCRHFRARRTYGPCC